MIVSSAIKIDNLVVFGHRHADCEEYLWSHHIPWDRNTAVYGFWTDDNRFLNRVEAKQYAIACGQITESEYPALYSEDLW